MHKQGAARHLMLLLKHPCPCTMCNRSLSWQERLCTSINKWLPSTQHVNTLFSFLVSASARRLCSSGFSFSHRTFLLLLEEEVSYVRTWTAHHSNKFFLATTSRLLNSRQWKLPPSCEDVSCFFSLSLCLLCAYVIKITPKQSVAMLWTASLFGAKRIPNFQFQIVSKPATEAESESESQRSSYTSVICQWPWSFSTARSVLWGGIRDTR